VTIGDESPAVSCGSRAPHLARGATGCGEGVAARDAAPLGRHVRVPRDRRGTAMMSA
jgi:hypothetical protein